MVQPPRRRSNFAGRIEKLATQRFSPPDPGEAIDWVLVLDDEAQNFPAPGTRPPR